MSGRALPVFRYHPDPVASGVIGRSEETCPVCGEATGFAYSGPFYSVRDVSGICPWCIASGGAARKYDGAFMDSGVAGIGVAPEMQDELHHRTPGYVSWQTEYWPVHCEEPCAFQAYVGWREIADLEVELLADIEPAREEMNLSLAEFKESLVNGGSHQGYLFRCLHCGRHRLHTDID